MESKLASLILYFVLLNIIIDEINVYLSRLVEWTSTLNAFKARKGNIKKKKKKKKKLKLKVLEVLLYPLLYSIVYSHK